MLQEQRAVDLRRFLEVERICELRAAELERLSASRVNSSLPGAEPNVTEEQIQGLRDLRPLLAKRLSGEGIEIGALHRPLRVPPGVVVRYVDLRTRDENIAKFPDLPSQDIVETTFICDGQTLTAVPDGSQHFVIANHMLEHCVNPLQAVQNFLRVLKPLGRLFISLPDKRFTFDFKRAVTSWEHVLHDYKIGREVEERSVYEEFRQSVDENCDPDEAIASRLEIHHHAWTQGEILEFFVNARRRLNWPLEIESFAKQGCEVVLVLQKDDPPHEDHAKFAQASAVKATGQTPIGL